MGNTASNRLLMAGGGIPPGTPTSFTVANSTTTPKNVLLSWSAPTTPVTPLTGYKIYRGGSLIATQTGTTYTDSGVDYNTSYSYQVYAYNAFGNSPSPASGSVTTYPACNNSSGNVSGGSSTSVTVPAGCFKVRIRALSGGGGGGGFDNIHLGSCYPSSSGGGGGGYIDGKHSVTPGGTITVVSGAGGSPRNAGGYSGTSQCYINGGGAGLTSSNPGGAGGTIGVAPPGATYTAGEAGYNNSGTNAMDGGNPALAGTNPTGLFTHGYGANQTCGQCDGCNGPSATGYGGGGAGGTDSGDLYGERSYSGGSGAPGYAVWNFSET